MLWYRSLLSTKCYHILWAKMDLLVYFYLNGSEYYTHWLICFGPKSVPDLPHPLCYQSEVGSYQGTPSVHVTHPCFQYQQGMPEFPLLHLSNPPTMDVKGQRWEFTSINDTHDRKQLNRKSIDWHDKNKTHFQLKVQDEKSFLKSRINRQTDNLIAV